MPDMLNMRLMRPLNPSNDTDLCRLVSAPARGRHKVAPGLKYGQCLHYKFLPRSHSQGSLAGYLWSCPALPLTRPTINNPAVRECEEAALTAGLTDCRPGHSSSNKEKCLQFGSEQLHQLQQWLEVREREGSEKFYGMFGGCWPGGLGSAHHNSWQERQLWSLGSTRSQLLDVEINYPSWVIPCPGTAR